MKLKSKKILSILSTTIFIVFVASLLALGIRGNMGSPTQKELLNKKWLESGPFELSPERGRFERKLTLVSLWDMMDTRKNKLI